MQEVEKFKNLLVKLVEEGKPNMGKNQVVDRINTAYETFKIIRGSL